MLKKYTGESGRPVYLDLTKANVVNPMSDGRCEVVFGRDDVVGVYVIMADESLIDRDIAPVGNAVPEPETLWGRLMSLGWELGCGEDGNPMATRENGTYTAVVEPESGGRVKLTITDRNTSNVVSTSCFPEEGAKSNNIRQIWDFITKTDECLAQDVLVGLEKFGWQRRQGLYGHRMVKRNSRYEICAQNLDKNIISVGIHQIADMCVPVCDPLKFTMPGKGKEKVLAEKIDETVMRNYGSDLELMWLNVLKDCGWNTARNCDSEIYALGNGCEELGYTVEISVLKSGKIAMDFRNDLGDVCDSIEPKMPVDLMQPAGKINKAVQKACRLAYELERIRKSWEP